MVSKFCAFVQLMTLAGGQVDLLPAVYRNSLTDQNESRHRLLADHRTGRVLTERCKLGDRVALQVGNALNLPYPDQTFDVVWCENAGCLRPNLPISSGSTCTNGLPRSTLSWSNWKRRTSADSARDKQMGELM